MTLKRFCLFLFSILIVYTPLGFAQTYEELVTAIRSIKDTGPKNPELSERRLQVENAWGIGKILDDYLLERSQRATDVVNQLASDLKEDPSRIYYDLQFARTYPDAPPALDLHWGFYQYLLAVNDPREREELARRAFDEKWNWDKLRAEIKHANRDNKEFVFTDVPGKTGVYRVIKAKRGPYRGELVLDLGFGTYLKPKKLKLSEYDIVEAECSKPADPNSCKFKSVAGGEKDLFTYSADVVQVIDGDTFQAVVDLGFGLTTFQTFRLWNMDAPEINTKEGRETKKKLESLLMNQRVVIRAMSMEKYGRYLADVWSFPEGNGEPVYINQTFVDLGLGHKLDRASHLCDLRHRLH